MKTTRPITVVHRCCLEASANATQPKNAYFRYCFNNNFGKILWIKGDLAQELFSQLLTFAAMDEVLIKIVNQSDNALPEYATSGSAGMDLKANLPAPVSLKPLQRQMIPTGLYIELPDGFEGQVRPRSGMANKQGITCLNSPGTIDSDYRGELKIILVNLSDTQQVIRHGDRIAQLIIAKVEKATWQLVPQLNNSKRGEGGFGHTGSN